MSEYYGLPSGSEITEDTIPLIIKELVGDSKIKSEIVEKLKDDLTEQIDGGLLWDGFNAVDGGRLIVTAYDCVSIDIDLDSEPYFTVSYVAGQDEDDEEEEYEEKDVSQNFNTLEECINFISGFN